MIVHGEKCVIVPVIVVVPLSTGETTGTQSPRESVATCRSSGGRPPRSDGVYLMASFTGSAKTVPGGPRSYAGPTLPPVGESICCSVMATFVLSAPAGTRSLIRPPGPEAVPPAGPITCRLTGRPVEPPGEPHEIAAERARSRATSGRPGDLTRLRSFEEGR